MPSQTYLLYGHSIRSTWSLPYLPQTVSNLIDFEFLSEPDLFFSDEIQGVIDSLDESAWFHHILLRDGSDFIRWTGLYDFLVSPDGQKIIGRSLIADSLEKFQTYFLGQVLSFAMVRRGVEPLHSTAVVIDGQAVAFLGNCGSGKSTIAGALLQAGFQILTDDMLVIKKSDNFYAYPGPPRIKLFPEIAKALIGKEVVGTPMNPATTKLIIPLANSDVRQTATPIKVFYWLQSPIVHCGKIMVNPLSPSQAFLAFIQNTFNTVIKGPERLTQQFNWAAELSANLPVKSLAYPRELSILPKLINTILKDIS